MERKSAFSTGPAVLLGTLAAAGAGAWWLTKRFGWSPDRLDKPAAHRADGQDDSASFGAMIADEGTIPEQTPVATDDVQEPGFPNDLDIPKSGAR